MSTVKLILVKPGIYAEQGLIKADERGHAELEQHVIDHYGQLLGRTVKRILFERYEGQVLPCLEFADGSTAAVFCDPEGNGPGYLDIQKK